MKYSNLPRVYINDKLLENKNFYLKDSYYHYLNTVLRLIPGNKFRIFNAEDGEFIAQIIEIQKRSLALRIETLLRKPLLLPPLVLVLAIIKPERMHEAINMATQLGVTEIFPCITDRTQIRTINHDRFTKYITEATEQSERLTPPLLHKPVYLNDYNYQQEDIVIYANEQEGKVKSLQLLPNLRGRIAVIIGPEGGLSQNDLSILTKWPNACSVSLSPHVLRTETATAAALAQIQLLRQ